MFAFSGIVWAVPNPEPINVAVASNFASTMQTIIDNYSAKTEQPINLLAGSTGKHYLQIIHAAPIDIFFAADQKRPQALLKRGKAGDVFTYAIGKLVYWIPDYRGRPITFEQAVRLPAHHISLANPQHAPYGLAAQQTLEKLALWGEKNDCQYVLAENVGQSYHLTKSKAVDAGFVAYSQIKKTQPDGKTFWLVPQDYYTAIRQDVAVIRPSKKVSDFLRYFTSSVVQETIKADGYQLPSNRD